MGREELLNKLRAYEPYNEQEKNDKELMISLISASEDIALRTCSHAHLTASAWIVNREHTHILMAYHKLYDSWAWIGGHADGETDLLNTALREAGEETGLKNIKPVTDDIFSIELLTVDGHEKKGRYVSSHLHLNFTYLIEADDKDELKIKPDENTDVRWFLPEEALSYSSEPWFVERVYKKLEAKRKKL